jgi:uncharacterized membrane protein YfcA
MDPVLGSLLAAGMLVAAFVYATVGHGGASAYLAVMALAGVAPQGDAADRAASQYRRVVDRYVQVPARRLFPLALVLAVRDRFDPMAFAGGAITLPGQAYKILVGLVLLYAAWQLWLSARAGDEIRPMRDPPLGWAMGIGAAMGLLAGLTGVGGGIFLSPLLLMLGWAGTKQTRRSRRHSFW